MSEKSAELVASEVTSGIIAAAATGMNVLLWLSYDNVWFLPFGAVWAFIAATCFWRATS